MTSALKTVLTPAYLGRTLLITVIVGSWLTAFNHGDALAAGVWDTALGLKILLNYVTPFVVANLGLLSHGFPEAPACLRAREPTEFPRHPPDAQP
jgi:hypothetical protein